jgi:hypothetical protein
MSNRGRTLTAVTVASLLACGMATSAQAADLDLKELAAASRVVVHSRVSKVEYGWSEAGAQGQAAVPYTLVTYDVVKPVQGSIAAASFTLRFVGGPDGRGRFMRASNVPVFQQGDEDILFVRNSGEKGCALAGCADGRFRILNGLIYDGTGVPVQRVESGRVVAAGDVPAELGTFRFPRPAFDDLLKNAEARAALNSQGLSVAEARRRYEAEAPAMIEMSMLSGGASSADRSGQGTGQADSVQSGRALLGRTMTADSFVGQLATLELPSAEGAPAFQGLAPDRRIAAPSTQQAAPAKARSSATTARSQADIAEEMSLPKDDPSITRHKSP